jgi:hypothetical protein
MYLFKPHDMKASGRAEVYLHPLLTSSRDSSVGIATGYGLDDRGVGVRVPVGSKIFTSPYRPDPTSYKMGTGALSRG